MQQPLRLPSLKAPIIRYLTLPSTNNRLRPYSVWHHVGRTWLSKLWINPRLPTSVENRVTLWHRSKKEESLIRHYICLTLFYKFFNCYSTVNLYLTSYINIVKVASTYTKGRLNFIQLSARLSPSLPWKIAAINVYKLLLVRFVLCVYETCYLALLMNIGCWCWLRIIWWKKKKILVT
jgi:hypothetical protein